MEHALTIITAVRFSGNGISGTVDDSILRYDDGRGNRDIVTQLNVSTRRKDE